MMNGLYQRVLSPRRGLTCSCGEPTADAVGYFLMALRASNHAEERRKTEAVDVFLEDIFGDDADPEKFEESLREAQRKIRNAEAEKSE